MTNSFYTKVVGVSFTNDNGTDRQKILKTCRVGQKLKLIPAPTKEHPNSVKVCLENGKQIGHLNDRLGGEISRLISSGGKAEAVITDLTGGTRGKETRGCNIQVFKHEKGAKITNHNAPSNNSGCASLILIGIVIPILIKTLC